MDKLIFKYEHSVITKLYFVCWFATFGKLDYENLAL